MDDGQMSNIGGHGSTHTKYNSRKDARPSVPGELPNETEGEEARQNISADDQRIVAQAQPSQRIPKKVLRISKSRIPRQNIVHPERPVSGHGIIKNDSIARREQVALYKFR